MGSTEIFFWWLVVSLSGYGAAAVPVPYQTEESCQWAAQEAEVQAVCIPQRAADVAEFEATKEAGRD